MDLVREPSIRSWEDFLSHTEGASIFQSPRMRDVYASSRGYHPNVVALETNEGIQALVASVTISYARGPAAKFASRTVITGGPLGNADLFKRVLELHDSVAARNAVSCQIRNLRAPSDRKVFEESGYQWEDHLNYQIDLRLGTAAILAGMSKARRKGIAAAERSNLEFSAVDSGEIDHAFGLLRETYTRAGVPLADATLFKSADRILRPKGELLARAAGLNGVPCAIRFVLRSNETLYDWYAGSSDVGRARHADEWLVWQILIEGVEQGRETFDFGGAGRPSEHYGPGEFKRRFGGQELNPGRFEKVYRPLVQRAASMAYGIRRRLT